MSFRFVGTALSILGTTGASSYYLTNPQASAPKAPTVVVAVSQMTPAARPRLGTDAASVALAVLAPGGGASPSVAPYAPPPARPTEVAARPARDDRPFQVASGTYWRPRIWVGPGAAVNPLTGGPLSREENESGWVDGPSTMGRDGGMIAEAPYAPVAAATPAPMPAPVTAPPAPAYQAMAAAPRPAPVQGVQFAAIHPMVPGDQGLPHIDQVRAASHAAAPPPPSAGAGGYRIHLASYKNGAAIEDAWNQLRSSQPEVLDVLAPSTMTVTLPGKGAFVRLLAGPFDSREAADQACAQLRKSHQYCQPIPPGHEAS